MDRYRVIAKFAKQHNWKQGLELGVWVGVTTFFMMRETDVTMYCVDSWEEQPDNPEYDWQFNKKPRWKNGTLTVEEFTNHNQVWDHNKNEKHFRDNAEQWGDRIKIIKGRALDGVVDQIPDNSMDFVFHDSDHSYPYVLEEIKAYAPKLKPNGMHIGDDYNWGTVRQSVEEAFGKGYNVMGKGVWYAPRYNNITITRPVA